MFTPCLGCFSSLCQEKLACRIQSSAGNEHDQHVSHQQLAIEVDGNFGHYCMMFSFERIPILLGGPVVMHLWPWRPVAPEKSRTICCMDNGWMRRPGVFFIADFMVRELRTPLASLLNSQLWYIPPSL
eukprot:s1468_g13.t1